MALIFKFDPEQLQTLVTAINDLSNNLAKWQGKETEAIQKGFTDLVETLGETDNQDAQGKINELASTVGAVKDKLKSSVDSQTKGD